MAQVLKDFKHLLHRHKKVDFIEQFNEKLLVKQENENLQIVDVRQTAPPRPVIASVHAAQSLWPSRVDVDVRMWTSAARPYRCETRRRRK